MFIEELYKWCDARVENLEPEDKYSMLKACGYGMIRGIPEGLMLVGAMAYAVAFSNLLRGKGWTVCPKD